MAMVAMAMAPQASQCKRVDPIIISLEELPALIYVCSRRSGRDLIIEVPPR